MQKSVMVRCRLRTTNKWSRDAIDKKKERNPEAKSFGCKIWAVAGMRERCCGRFQMMVCLRSRGPALLEVISVDYRGRVQRTTVPCNLPPWKIDAGEEWSDTCTYRGKRTRGWTVVKRPGEMVFVSVWVHVWTQFYIIVITHVRLCILSSHNLSI